MGATGKAAGAAPFGWRWIGRSVLLRRWQAATIIILTGISYAASLVVPISAQKAVDSIIAHRAGLDLAALAVLALGAIALEASVFRWQRSLVVDLGAFLDQRISRRAFTHLMRVRTDGAQFKSGDAINHFQQVTKIREFALRDIPAITFDAGGAIVSLALIFYYDIFIAIMLLVSPILIVMARKQISELERVFREYYELIGKRQNVLSETVGGIGTVKALALEGARTRRWEGATDEMLDAMREGMRLNNSFMLRAQIYSRSLSMAVLAVGCWRLYQGAITVGELMALQLLSGRITWPMIRAGDLYRVYQEVNIAISQVAGFLDQPREEAAVRPPLRRIGRGGIGFANVSLTYPGATRPALQDIDLTLPERGLVALVGRNGSGKSTLIRILLGLRRDYEGVVTIGGRDLRDYDPRWLRSRIGVVDQDVVLFSGTVRDNLAVGRHTPEARLREALAFSGALGFVDELAGGLGAELAEGGRSLSGGQRQRLSIARAMIRDPHIVLLDEPTAFLDAEAAVALERQFMEWGRDRLLLLVSHHLAATRNADRILVLDGGRLVGDGSHEHLLADVPEYASLWADYARSLQPAADQQLVRLGDGHPL